MTKQREYQNAFDVFVRTRGIDEDDAYWSDGDFAAWDRELVRLRSSGVL